MDLSKYVKGDNEHDTCKDHSARTQKDQYRIYPSKLSKKELEDVYYSLIDSNLQLKKTINKQQDQIKLLSTKINRITTQRNIYGPQKGCCKDVLSEHRDVILDLKQVNEKLRERVRLLNMQLCSAKQFLKRSPLQTSKCQNCMNIRNSTSTLHAKKSQATLRMKSTSSQYLDKDVTPLTLADALKDSAPEQVECTQNKCKTTIEELQADVDNLQKELAKSREQSHKLTDLEEEIKGYKDDLHRARTQARVAEESLLLNRGKYQDVLKNLRTVEAQNDSISLELTLERQLVRQLQTELRAEVASRAILALSHASHEPSHLSHGPVRPGKTSPVEQATREIQEASHEQPQAPSYELSHMSHAVRPGETSAAESHRPRFKAELRQIEYGGGDNRVYEIEQESKETVNIRDEQKTKTRKERNRKVKRNSSVEKPLVEIQEERRSTGGISTRVPTSTGTDKHERTDDDDVVEDSGNGTEESQPRKIYRDVGVQSAEKEFVSRGVGDEVEMRTSDAGVQIGDSLRARHELDTRTYSRRSKSRTYSVDKQRGAAADTDGEMSSLSDLPTERDSPPSDYFSPGEQLSPSSCTGCTSADELSEGELPLLGNKLSYGEVDARGVAKEIRPISPSVRMQRAIQDVKQELTRCNQLLGGAAMDPAACRLSVNPFGIFRSRDASRLY